MTKWTFTENDDGTVTIEWEGYDSTVNGDLSSQRGGFPVGLDNGVEGILEQIDSIPEGLKAVADYRPGNIEINQNEQS